MTDNFNLEINPGRVVFGQGTLATVADEIERLGARHALVLSTPAQQADAQRLADALGPRAAGVFGEAAMHTPVPVTLAGLAAFEACKADCVIALGGGSTIGLAKAISLRNGAPQIAIPTTYAGSEVTPVVEQTENGAKTTLKDMRILPKVVIYDPSLTLDLPVSLSVTSGLNAMAHAIEGMYAHDRNPVSTLQAVEGIRALRDALGVIVKSPRDAAARTNALYGSWLCGTVLGTLGMALHHKLCHTLGGSFNLPHSELHAILLPHTVAFNLHAAPAELRPLADLFGEDVGAGLQDFARSLGAPLALRDLGLEAAQLEAAAELAVTNPYWNPRPVERDALLAMLRRAWEGSRPA
jgi:maleylacetate reductase